MATIISAVMTVTDQTGKQGSKSITNIKPDANRNSIVDFARGLNALTTNTLDSVELVTKEDILSDYDTTDPQLSIDVSSLPFETYANFDGYSTMLQLNYKGDERTVTFSGQKYSEATFTQRTNKQIMLNCRGGAAVQSGDANAVTTITVAAGGGYKEASINFTFEGLDPSWISNV